MIKLYKKEKELFFYAECWIHNNTATVHIGKVGEIGENKQETCKDEASYLQKFVQTYTGKGYYQIPQEDQFWMVLQWPMKTLQGSSYNHGIQKKTTNILNELLGWNGLGRVDGYDMGKSSNPKEEFVLNIFCLIVSTDLALQHITDILPKQVDCSRLKIAIKGYDDVNYTLEYHAKDKENCFYI